MSTASTTDLRRVPITAPRGDIAGHSGSLTLLLHRTAADLETQIAERLAEAGLTTQHHRVLQALAEEPGQTMSRLATSAVLPAATLTRHMDALVERGLVVRRIHPKDKRRVVAALSTRGASVIAGIRDAEVAAEADLRKFLGLDSVTALLPHENT